MTAAAARWDRIVGAVKARPGLWLAITLGFPVLYHVAMLLALLARFQEMPNYTVTYDWLGSMVEIVRSTPAFSDMPAIMAEEWLFEIGRMNYDFGNGISEWSMNVNPFKVMIITILASLIATIAVLALSRRKQCSGVRLNGAGAAGGVGAVLVGMTNVTLAWVVCCATPNWVVGLAILGLGTSTSLWLEQFGWWFEYAGFALLLAAVFWLSGDTEPKIKAPTSGDKKSFSHSTPQSAMGAHR